MTIRKRCISPTEEALHAALAEMNDLYDQAPCAYHSLDADGLFVRANATELSWLGYSREEFVGKVHFVDLLTPDSLATFQKNFPAFKERGHVHGLEFTLIRKDGTTFPVLLSATAVNDADGRYVRSLSTMVDMSERKRADDALRLTQLSVDRAADLIHWIAPDGRLIYVSDSVCRRHGCSREQLLQRSVFDLDPTLSPERWSRHWEELREQGSVVLETTHRTESGDEFPVEVTANFVEQDGEEYNFAFARDISRRRRVEEALLRAKEQTEAANRELASDAAALEAANATITQIAATDDLTGLANRRYFHECLEKAVSLARRHGSPLAVASFDLDGLKRVNDSVGHAAGDEVLTSFAALLGSLCRAEDLPGRLGGDEFSVLLPGSGLSGACGLAERVLAAVRSHEALQQRGVTVSVGVAQWSPDEPPDDLLRRADEALYAAKRGGGGSVAG